MLSEDAIEKLVAPIVARQENINMQVILIIAKRINETGEILPSDVYRLERLLKTGADVKKINQLIATLTSLQVRDIKQLIKVVALDAYIDTKPFYDYRHKSFIPFNKNVPLQRIVNVIANQTADEYKNLVKAQAFMIRDPKNREILKPTPIAEAYQSVVDEAIQATSTGIFDYSTTIRKTLKQLIDSGIRYVKYDPESGRVFSQRLDTAVRRNVLDGVRQINQGVQDETGKQFGADGIELSVHAHPAPDHALIQGRQYTMSDYEKMQNEQDFVDTKGRKYPAMKRAIGHLNCRHFAWNIILGFANPNYTDEQLQKILDDNEKGYTDSNGKHYTLYECTQHQRRLETEIRKAKEGQIAAKEAGDMDLAREYQATINKKTAEYNQFSNACGLPVRKRNLTVSGYRKIS